MRAWAWPGVGQMRKLGLIGGVSWVSTAMYYDQINKAVVRAKGGASSAPLLIESLDFAPMVDAQQAGDWATVSAILADSGRRLEAAGAEGLILCSNTAHKGYDRVAAEVGVPVLHIAEVTAARLARDGVRRVALLGTRFTMNERFCRDPIEAAGIEVSVPAPEMMQEVDRIIYEELARGIVTRTSQRTLKTCITIMAQAKAQAVVLGCTELVLLVDPGANVIPVYDTTALHAQAAAEWILAPVAERSGEPPVRLAATG